MAELDLAGRPLGHLDREQVGQAEPVRRDQRHGDRRRCGLVAVETTREDELLEHCESTGRDLRPDLHRRRDAVNERLQDGSVAEWLAC